MQRVCFESDGSCGAELAKFPRSAIEHGPCEIGCEKGSRAAGSMLEKSYGHVARAAADVEDGCVGIGKGGMKRLCCSSPPEPVDIGREKVVEEIVTGRD